MDGELAAYVAIAAGVGIPMIGLLMKVGQEGRSSFMSESNQLNDHLRLERDEWRARALECEAMTGLTPMRRPPQRTEPDEQRDSAEARKLIGIGAAAGGGGGVTLSAAIMWLSRHF